MTSFLLCHVKTFDQTGLSKSRNGEVHTSLIEIMKNCQQKHSGWTRTSHAMEKFTLRWLKSWKTIDRSVQLELGPSHALEKFTIFQLKSWKTIDKCRSIQPELGLSHAMEKFTLLWLKSWNTINRSVQLELRPCHTLEKFTVFQLKS